LASVPAGRPLAERLAGAFLPLPDTFLGSAPVRRFFARITVLWAFVQLANAGLSIWLLLTQPVATYYVAKTAGSWLLTGGPVLASTLAFRWQMRRHGITVHRRGTRSARPPAPDAADGRRAGPGRRRLADAGARGLGGRAGPRLRRGSPRPVGRRRRARAAGRRPRGADLRHAGPRRVRGPVHARRPGGVRRRGRHRRRPRPRPAGRARRRLARRDRRAALRGRRPRPGRRRDGQLA